MKACAICSQSDVSILYWRPSFDVVRCRHCGLVYVNSRLSEVEQMQHSLYATIHGDEYMETVYEKKQESWLRYFSAHLDKIAAHSQGRRILDIGCGVGFFLYAAERKGWEAYGLEISKPQVEYAREKLGLNVMATTLEEANFPEAYFDVVTLWSVIEHVSAPLALVQEIRKVIARDGLLLLKTPNQDSLISRLCWALYKLSLGKLLLPIYSADGHIYRFSPRTMVLLLDRGGFDVEEVDREDDLEFMATRTLFGDRWRSLKLVGLYGVHLAASLLRMQNQIIVHARPK